MKKQTLKKSQPKKDYNASMRKLLKAILVLSCVICAVSVIAILLVGVGIVGAIASDNPALAVVAIMLGAIIILSMGSLTIAWATLIIVSLVYANKQTCFDPKLFKIFFSIILGVVVASLIVSTIFAYAPIASNDIIDLMIKAFGSLETVGLIGSIVLSAVYVHQINVKRA